MLDRLDFDRSNLNLSNTLNHHVDIWFAYKSKRWAGLFEQSFWTSECIGFSGTDLKSALAMILLNSLGFLDLVQIRILL